MSVIGLRDWQIWTNGDYFTPPGSVLHGEFRFTILPLLMAGQTVDFIREQVEDLRTAGIVLGTQVTGYVASTLFGQPGMSGGNLLLYKRQDLDTSASLADLIGRLLDELRALSLCVDFPLACNRIEYYIPPGQPDGGDVLIAVRKALVRGIGFSDDERAAAAERIRNHFDRYETLASSDITAAEEHYVTGLTLLVLTTRSPD